MENSKGFFEEYWPYLVGAVAVYFVFKKLSSITTAAVESVAAPIANAYVDLTQPPAVKLLASIVLPPGQMIDANSVTLDDNMQFRFNGAVYRLDHRNSDNNYVAVIA